MVRKLKIRFDKIRKQVKSTETNAIPGGSVTVLEEDKQVIEDEKPASDNLIKPASNPNVSSNLQFALQFVYSILSDTKLFMRTVTVLVILLVSFVISLKYLTQIILKLSDSVTLMSFFNLGSFQGIKQMVKSFI